MKLTTAGESHGKALVAIIEGLPAHLALDMDGINGALALRQSGYGRGARQISFVHRIGRSGLGFLA